MGLYFKSKVPLFLGALAIATIAGIASAAEPVISSITVTPTDSTAIINWTTDIPSTSQVAYGTSMDLTASTSLDSGLVTNHMVALDNLAASTTYHFAVISSDATGSTTMSNHNLFTTLPFAGTPSAGATTTATTTPGAGSATSTTTTSTAFLNLSVFSGGPGESVIAVGTNFVPSEPITVNFNGELTNITTDAEGNFSTTLSVPSVPSGSIPISATGNTSGRVATNVFFVESTDAGTATTTAATTTTIAGLEDELSRLRAEVTLLKQQVATLMTRMEQMMRAGMMSATTSGGSNTDLCTADPSAAGHIDQNGASVRAGTNIDFGGHGFGCEESIIVTRGGVQVGSAFTNRAGSFSTGSLPVPALGSHTYAFTGRNSGTTASATITVVP